MWKTLGAQLKFTCYLLKSKPFRFFFSSSWKTFTFHVHIRSIQRNMNHFLICDVHFIVSLFHIFSLISVINSSRKQFTSAIYFCHVYVPYLIQLYWKSKDIYIRKIIYTVQKYYMNFVIIQFDCRLTLAHKYLFIFQSIMNFAESKCRLFNILT